MACGGQAPVILGWYAASIAFANRHFTDGVILPADLPLLIPSARPKQAVIDQLVAVKFWEVRPGGGWVIHDFLEHNNSAEYRRAKLHADAVRKRNGLRTESTRTPDVEPSLVEPRLAEPRRATPRKSLAEPGSPPIPPSGGFARFWAVYPRKIGKGLAERAWTKHRCEPLTPTILLAVEQQRAWLLRADPNAGKQPGDLCPYPATWLNQRRWQDEPPELASAAHQDRNLAGIANWLEGQHDPR